jgi:signal transduction histidine kinase
VISSAHARQPSWVSFRTKLLVAMMLVVTAVTALLLFVAQRNMAASVRRDLEQQFQGELASLHAAQAVRHAALAERCRALARRSRIHAALEDNALDLLYPSARDEMRDVMDPDDGLSREPAAYALHARYYRFLNGNGAVIAPPDSQDVGPLRPAEESRLTLRALPARPETGYLFRQPDGGGETIDEVIALPIVSTEKGEAIAALVLGFKLIDLSSPRADAGIKRGIWLNGRLHLPSLPEPARISLAGQVARGMTRADLPESSFTVQIDGSPCLLFYKLLNPESLFPPAYEVCIYQLSESIARQRRLVWEFVGAGVLLLGSAFIASRYLSFRLAVPVERLAVDSEENRTQRVRAETALELTHEELQRSARFSADASHQLKTPVTVLRAGLEELLAGENLRADTREEIAALVHQTFRLTSVIEDLLLLSRMDTGRLKLDLGPVDLTPLIEAWLDDLGALPDPLALKIETEVPAALYIAGEKRFTTLILQNLLENARKYNRPGGRIRVTVRGEGPWGILTVGNTGHPIPPAAQAHVFERFHRGTAGENVPGHGLGLNLARELARLHRGDLRLAWSADDWTEFEVRFRRASP